MTDSGHVLSSKIEVVTGGLANAGIRKHSFGSPGMPDAFALLEKRLPTRKAFKEEFELCKELCRLGNAGIHISPMPNVVSAVEVGDIYHVIMSYYQGVGVRLKDRNEHGRIIAKSIAKLNFCELDIPLKNRMELLIETNGHAPRPNEAYADYLEAAIEICKATLPEMFKSRAVKSHNDLFFPNIATEVYGDRYNIVLIDLGHICYNEIGADFHHFVRTGVADLNSTESTEVMIDEYARLTKTDTRIILINAHRFALLRLAERLRSALKANNEARFGSELKIGWMLYEAAKRQLQDMQETASKAAL